MQGQKQIVSAGDIDRLKYGVVMFALQVDKSTDVSSQKYAE